MPSWVAMSRLGVAFGGEIPWHGDASFSPRLSSILSTTSRPQNAREAWGKCFVGFVNET